MADWPREALRRLARDEPTALVTLLAVEGSTPREAGTKMLLWPTGQWGTIGGGNLEHQATAQARRMLALGENARFAVQDYPLGPLLAQCCGGRVRLLIERVDARDAPWLADAARRAEATQPFEIHSRVAGEALIKSVTPVADPGLDTPSVTVNGETAKARHTRPVDGDEIVERLGRWRPTLLLFGAGHVGQAIALALNPLPFRLCWYDSRTEFAAETGAACLGPEALAEIAGDGADFTLVLTHDHALDYALVSAALTGGGAGYLGLIGSRTKRARFLSRLRADGISEAALARLTCPIGMAQLKSKAPEIIAVSVAADLLLRLEVSRPAIARETVLARL